MSEANPKVRSMVERELGKNPDLSNQELRAKAEKIDASVKELSGRQFHAQYALPVRRQLPGTRKKARRAPARRRKAKGSANAGGTDPVIALLEASFAEKKSALDGAVHDAFRAAIDADSVQGVNKLLSWMDRQTRSLGKG